MPRVLSVRGPAIAVGIYMNWCSNCWQLISLSSCSCWKVYFTRMQYCWGVFYYCWQLLGGLISLECSIYWVSFYYCRIYWGASGTIPYIPPSYFGNTFTCFQYGMCYICPGPVFQCEFNFDVDLVIRLTKLGNLWNWYICICIQHQLSMWIQP